MGSPLRRGTVKRIHVSQPNIKSNRKHGTRLPVLSVVTSSSPVLHADTVEIRGPSRLVYRPDRPLSCGARVWVETRSAVVLDPEEG